MDLKDGGADNTEFHWMAPRELNQWDVVKNPDLAESYELDSQKHPTAEQMLIRAAVDKVLMRDQKKLWEMYAYDKLTVGEMAQKFKVTHQSISKRIRVAEKLIAKWCKAHWATYMLLKGLEENE